MRVPTAASMQAGRRESFAAQLERIDASSQPARVDPRHPAAGSDAEPTGANDVAPQGATDIDPRPEPAGGIGDDELVVAGAGDLPGQANAADRAGPELAAAPKPTNESVVEAHPVRSQDAVTAPAGTVTGGQSVAGSRLAGNQFAFGPAAKATTTASPNPVTRPIDVATRPSTPLPTPAATAGYRTWNAQSMQLLEQARDSVFKQILLKLGKDGGEMRLRLDPPEFGQLDLRLVVEQGNQLRLSIGAERPELQAWLQRHLDELKQSLQQAGLDVTHADVHAQTDASGGHASWQRDTSAFGGNAADDHEPAAPSLAAAGWTTAQGLDFWA